MYLKICRYRFLLIALLSLVTIVLIGNLYFKSLHEVSVVAKSKVDKTPRRHYENKLMNNDMHVTSSDENQIADNVDNYIAGYNECIMIDEANATIKTVDLFSKFEFNASWVLKRNGIWQSDFESRYNKQLSNELRPPLKVFILPHSHNDPGWLKTFFGYYDTETSKILNLIVDKLTKYEDMRFIWTEISFLNLWWMKATSAQQKAFEKLVQSGRLEIMTGGWVMTDEANVHLYAMLDQLIEGHQWVKNHLGISPKIGWSIDPFGQGSTIPHLLAKSGFDGAIIQRIHYNWKEFLARHQAGDFFWKPYWTGPKSSDYTLLTHNMPFDIYSTRHSCGPQPRTCDTFDYAVNPSSKKLNNDVSKKADVLIEQYGRTASLFTHNVALVLMGGDFTFKDESYFNDHYFSYKQLIDYINKNSKTRYNGATVQFGTPTDYFNEIKSRAGKKFPSLAGDFFPYSDIFSSGTPAYWTGYFTTRPFHKFMSRDLEHNLRNAEILFTLVMNKIRKLKNVQVENFAKSFDTKIVKARRNLGLFQHHDAITGTSKKAVMKDYLERLHRSVKDVLSVQQEAIEILLKPDMKNELEFVEHELERENAEIYPTQKVLHIANAGMKKIVIFNSLAQKRMEVISVIVFTHNVHIEDAQGRKVRHQINPVFDKEDDYEPSNMKYEALFLAKLEPMSLNVFIVIYEDFPTLAKVVCKNCKLPELDMKEKQISIANSRMKLMFDSRGFLQAVRYPESSEDVKLNVNFEYYKAVFSKSGAYLFKPRNSSSTDMFTKDPLKMYVVDGPIASDVTIVYGKILIHTVRIFNTKTHLDDAIYMTNDIDFGSPNDNRDVEMIMKLKTSIKNVKSDETEFFTDQNGFQWLPRRKISKLGVEGNYYPITSSMFIQDNSMRLTLATTHAQGATSMNPGELEVMLDRRLVYDDGRGMGEGVMDSVRMQHKFTILLEYFDTYESTGREFSNEKYQVPSLFAHHLINILNYPVNTFFIDKDSDSHVNTNIELFSHEFPCDTHLVNLRTINGIGYQWQPQESLLVLHRLSSDCSLRNDEFDKRICHGVARNKSIQLFNDVAVKNIKEASLTGLNVKEKIEFFNDREIALMELKTFLITFE